MKMFYVSCAIQSSSGPKPSYAATKNSFFLANIFGESESELGKSQINSGKRALTSVRPSQSDRFPLLCRPSIHYERPTNSQFTKWLIPTNSFSESICQEDQDISLRYHLFPPVHWFALNEKWFLFPAQSSSWMIHIWQSKLRVSINLAAIFCDSYFGPFLIALLLSCDIVRTTITQSNGQLIRDD